MQEKLRKPSSPKGKFLSCFLGWGGGFVCLFLFYTHMLMIIGKQNILKIGVGTPRGLL